MLFVSSSAFYGVLAQHEDFAARAGHDRITTPIAASMTDVYGAARPRRSARRRVATRQQQSFWRSLGIVPPPPPSGRLRAAWRLHGRRRDRGRRDGRRDRG